MHRRSAWANALINRIQPGLAMAYLAYALAGYGLQLVSSQWALWIAWYAGLLVVVVHAVAILLQPVPADSSFWRVQRASLPLWGWIALVVATFPAPGLFALACSITQLVILARWGSSSRLWSSLFPALMVRPAQTLAVSFLLLIGFGSLLLMLPRATTDGVGASWVDALFTATSASCVTGLTVLNTAPDVIFNPALQTYSRFGQTVILLLIQVGGLSIMTLSAALVILAGRSLDLRSRAALGDLMDEGEGRTLEVAVSFIFRMTFAVEAVGSLLLLARFSQEAPTLGEAVYQSVFHAISAFCNAGFGLFGDNLSRYVSDPLVSLTISSLIVIGGLGYATVACLTFSLVMRRHFPEWQRWMVHARLAGVFTVALLFIGTVFTFYVEYDRSLAGLPLGTKLLAAYFQSVTTRTAGFNTIDMASISRVTALFYVVLMFIGASPGGTGGGVKTTTFGVVVLGIRAVLLGRKDVEVWKRHVDQDVVLRSMSIVAISIMCVTVIWGALLVFEPDIDPLKLFFETVSAFGTVGLSMGVTSSLGVGAKLALSLLMYVGRIGPLGLAFALKSREKPVAVRYPTAKIAVG